jgi:hypothetical protein
MGAPIGPTERLLHYIGHISGDTEYVESLLDKIIADSARNGADRVVKAVWAEKLPPLQRGDGRSARYHGGWNDGVDASVDRIRATYLHTCAECKGAIGYVECPTGSWWAHETHPADDHDAVPVRP